MIGCPERDTARLKDLSGSSPGRCLLGFSSRPDRIRAGSSKASGRRPGRCPQRQRSCDGGRRSPDKQLDRDDDEFFLVLDGEIRIQLGDEVIEGVTGSLVYGPRDVAHSFHVDSEEARLLLLFGPAGVEGFFREGGKPAESRTLPPPGEEFLDRQALMQIAGRYGQQFVGPPLQPKD